MSGPSVLAERLTSQLLSGPPATAVVGVVDRLLAIQAQDPRGARLAVRSRSVGLHSTDVDAALNDRSVVITTVNRGTLHLIGAEDYWWLHPLTTPQLRTSNATRLAQEQVSPDAADRGVTLIADALARQGPLGRSTLRAQLVVAGIRVVGQAFAHLLVRATLDGLIVRGPIVDGEHAFVLVRDWLGPAPAAVDRDTALAELARRYLVGHGPAADGDLARWAGITLGDARRGLGAIAGQLVERSDGLAAFVDRGDPAALPPPRLLGSFDPCLFGWVSREPTVGAHQGIVTTNGIFRPFAMVKGKAVATWTLTRQDLAITAFTAMSAATSRVLQSDGRAVVDFLYASD